MSRAKPAEVFHSSAGFSRVHRVRSRAPRVGSFRLAGSAGEWEQANSEGFGTLRAWVDRKVQAGELRPMPFPAWQAVVFAPAMLLTPYWVRQPAPDVPPKIRAALEHAAWAAVAP